MHEHTHQTVTPDASVSCEMRLVDCQTKSGAVKYASLIYLKLKPLCTLARHPPPSSPLYKRMSVQQLHRAVGGATVKFFSTFLLKSRLFYLYNLVIFVARISDV